MEFTQLDANTYKNELIAKNVYSREQEFFHYEFDKKNFEHLLTILPDGPRKQDVQQRLASTIEQMNYVDAICTALKAQIANPVAYEAAVIKTTTERLEAANKAI